MKYISKRYQKFLSQDLLEEYTNLKAKRVSLTKKANKIEEESNRRKSDLWDSKNLGKYESTVSKILKIENKINDLEYKAFELAESLLCKEGNIIIPIWDKYEKHKRIISEKKNRDYYNVFYLKEKIEKSVFWKDIVKYYNLSTIN